MSQSKTIVLTGASGGMGMRIAQTLAREGHRVFAGMRDIKGRNAQKAAELSALPNAHPIVPVDLDVTSDESVARCASEILAQAPRIDVLINCAGVMPLGTSEAFSTDQFRSLLETNLLGPFRMFKAFLPTMRAVGAGLVITITSTCGRLVVPGAGIYTASKFGLEGLAEAIGYEVSGLGIDTVILQPGPFETNLMVGQQQAEREDIVKEYGEFGRLKDTLAERLWPMLQEANISLDPQQVADAVLSLIDMEPGERPIRTTVGMDSGVSDMNRQIEDGQRAYMRTVGFEGLARMQRRSEDAPAA